jgi:multidrug efflux pump
MITDIFIKRPVLAICISLILLLGGVMAILNLNTRQYPRSDLAVVTVKTVYVGADADLVQGFITTPLERAIASADGIDYMESSSAQSLSTITAHLRLNFDINAALTQIQSKVAQVRNDLPPEAEVPTIDVETSDSRFAAIYLSFSSNELKENQITDYLLRVVQPKLSSLPGVQKADLLGARTFAMRIWLDSDRMAAFGISPAELRLALQRNNFLSAPGNTKGSMTIVNLSINTDLSSAAEFEKLVIKKDGNTLVRLKDVAKVELGAENYDEEVRFNGKKATFVGVWALPNANVLDVVKHVRKSLDDLRANLPSGLTLTIPYDSTKFIESAISEVLITFSETILIVIIVIFLFIGSLRSVLVPIVAIPLSLVGAAGLMYLFGFSLNLLTLLAIVLAVGLVVDDAIVMLENIERHVHDGDTPYNAAIKGARELVGPIISMTITLAAVYAPIGIQGGLTGVLFREFALTLAGAVAVSGFVALTLSPMMCSKLVRPGNKASKFKLRIEAIFEKLQFNYRNLLEKVLEYKPAIISASIVLVLVLPLLYLFSAKELAPREDRGILFGIVQAAPNSSIEQTTIYTKLVQGAFESFPEYENSFQRTGPNVGFSGLIAKPWSERSRSVLDMEGEAWAKTSKVPGVRVIITSPPPLPGGSNFPVEFVITSTDTPEELYKIAGQFVQTAFASGKFIFADADLKFDMPQSEIVVDREKLASLGLDLRSVGNDLAVLTGGNYVNRISIQGRSYKVIAQTKRKNRLNPEQLLDLYISGPDGKLISLSTVAHLKNTTEPRELKHFQQLNSVTIQGALVPGTSIDSALSVLETKAKEILPTGYQIDYAGESRQLRQEGDSLLITLFFAIILIYLVLAAQFESFRDPFIILAGSVPLSMAGSLIFSFLGFTSMNIYSQVGLVTLVGLVAKNGILIVEFANTLQEAGRSKLAAVIEASATRLRPILMTSCATVIGHFPLIFAAGAGAEARNSIGIILVSGMFIGTFFTLFVVPVIYVVVAKDKQVESEPTANINFTNGIEDHAQ